MGGEIIYVRPIQRRHRRRRRCQDSRGMAEPSKLVAPRGVRQQEVGWLRISLTLASSRALLIESLGAGPRDLSSSSGIPHARDACGGSAGRQPREGARLARRGCTGGGEGPPPRSGPGRATRKSASKSRVRARSRTRWADSGNPTAERVEYSDFLRRTLSQIHTEVCWK